MSKAISAPPSRRADKASCRCIVARIEAASAAASAFRASALCVIRASSFLAADTVDEDMLSLIRQKAGDFEAVIEGGPNGGPKGRSIEGELLVRLARKGSGTSTTVPSPVELSPVRPAAKTEPASRPATFPARQAPRLSRMEIAGTLAIPQLRPLLLPLRPQG
ncbi:MAG: hypothetical protein ACYCZN_04485 [Candidatus Dormibacteria bacterium]